MPNPQNKITFTPDQHRFLKEHYRSMTNQQLADALGMRLTRTRMEMYKMGLQRMELEYWTDKQVAYLKEYYRTIGDTELSKLYNIMWHKKKGWSKRQISKKRKQLKLQRTAKELMQIKKRNIRRNNVVSPKKRAYKQNVMYEHKRKFANLLGYKDVTEAIGALGVYDFNKKYKELYS